jgi:hypothetical protein
MNRHHARLSQTKLSPHKYRASHYKRLQHYNCPLSWNPEQKASEPFSGFRGISRHREQIQTKPWIYELSAVCLRTPSKKKSIISITSHVDIMTTLRHQPTPSSFDQIDIDQSKTSVFSIIWNQNQSKTIDLFFIFAPQKLLNSLLSISKTNK